MIVKMIRDYANYKRGERVDVTPREAKLLLKLRVAYKDKMLTEYQHGNFK